MPIGGITGPYPNLQSIADLFRSGINDTFNNAGGSGTGYGGGAGIVMPNSNPDLLTFMGSAIQEMFSDLSNVGSPELVIDNYLLLGIPALATPDPTVQVSLSYSGYFNGVTNSDQWTLPGILTRLSKVSERWSNTNESFVPMTAAPFGLPQQWQGDRMGTWEMRQGALWMPGCLQPVDLSLRGRISFPIPMGPNLNFTTTFVPILVSQNAIAAKMLILYAKRFAPENYQMAVTEETRLMSKLRLESVRQMQAAENIRASFGDEATADFAIAWSQL